MLSIYRVLSPTLARGALKRADARLSAAGIPEIRLGERRGHPTEPRGSGKLVWIHAASVGESLSALPLVTRLSPQAGVLVTTGTATSARMMAARLPEAGIHQFAPVDTPEIADRFLDHWRPDLAVFVESEIWPNLLAACKNRGIPLALVNARLSERSLRGWGRFPRTAARVFGQFDAILTQDDRTRDGINRLLPGGRRAETGGNLKTAIPPPPADADELATWKSRLGDRPVWTASSTHTGEDEDVLVAHATVLERHPKALLLLLPRHPERGEEVTQLSLSQGYRTLRRSDGADWAADTQVYVVDTLGETGLWYRLAPLVFLAGSFGAAGGHNPWEPVSLGCALLHGPNVPNAEEDYAQLVRLSAARPVADAAALGQTLRQMIDDPAQIEAMQQAARAASEASDDRADRYAAVLLDLLEGQSR